LTNCMKYYILYKIQGLRKVKPEQSCINSSKNLACDKLLIYRQISVQVIKKNERSDFYEKDKSCTEGSRNLTLQ